MPPEPGRIATIAATQAAREQRGIRQQGHDGLESRVCAMRRVLWRFRDQGRASGQYACSLEQLTVAIAPIVGWGPVPPASTTDRAKWFRAHRRSVQRWLELLQDAGMVHVSGVRDSEGYWWRTVITLLPHGGPQLDDERLAAARKRVRGFKHRERARQRQETRRAASGGPRRRLRSLTLVLRDSACPSAARRRQLAIVRGVSTHERRRRAGVAAVIAERQRVDQLRVLTHPYGAPASLESTTTFREATTSDETGHLSSVQTLTRHDASADKTRTHTSAPDTQPKRSQATTAPRLVTEEKGSVSAGDEDGSVWSQSEIEREILARVAARERERAPGLALAGQAVARRAAQVAGWPQGKPCPRWMIREAWVALHPTYGVGVAADSGTAAAGNVDPAKLHAAVAAYERHSDCRPPGWPDSGPGALSVLAARGEAHMVAGDVARLACIARDMQAAAELHDPDRVARDRARAERRRSRGLHSPPPHGRLAFRAERSGRHEDAETMRLRQRDLLLFIGANPALFPNLGWAEERLLQAEARGELPPDVWPLPSRQAALRRTAAARDIVGRVDLWAYRPQDGRSRRAERYGNELRAGRWAVPPHWSQFRQAFRAER